MIGKYAEIGADHSIKLKHTERGLVLKVLLSSKNDGKNFAVVSIRQSVNMVFHLNHYFHFHICMQTFTRPRLLVIFYIMCMLKMAVCVNGNKKNCTKMQDIIKV